MNDLQMYNYQKDEIDRLNKQINMISFFYKNFYKDKIKELENKLSLALKMKSEYKRKSELIKPPTRKQRVFNMLSNGERDYKLIADKCFTTYDVVRNYACEFKKENSNGTN